MKHLTRFLAVLILGIMNHYNLQSQNPNWTLPSGFLDLGLEDYNPLAQSPAWPSGYTPGDLDWDQYFRYQGEASEFVHTGYSGPDGELMCFVVDGRLYDSKGWLVNFMHEVAVQVPTTNNPKGWNEMLILPMGNSCTKFAIIYPSTENNVVNQLSWPEMYMAVYDTEVANTFNPFAKGSMVGQGVDGLGATLQNISAHFRQNHSTPGDEVFLARAGYQIAATELIDNCFRYVMLSDGKHLLRYKLDQSGLHYDGYKHQFQQAGGSVFGALRSEMELISWPTGRTEWPSRQAPKPM